ncbi:MAG TPA: glycosyltransferase [Mycobacteriales bacterium]|nr:glycosyltransferase [Mycobacteriales bacterium]
MPPALTVLMNAGPWLPVPPPAYGGIENVVATLVPELRARGHRVVLATVGESRLAADEQLSVFPTGQFPHITGPYNQMMGIAHAHMRAVLERLGEGDVDLVHDHLEVVGPALLAAAGEAIPPVLQTLHWDLAKHPDFYGGFDGGGRIFFAGVSDSQLARAHPTLRRQALGAVSLATPLPEHPVVEPAGHLLTLGRLTAVKGYDLAARAARELGLPLVMAGPVAGYADRAALDAALADPAGPSRSLGDVRYFREEVEPHVDGDTVRWVGSLGGQAKAELLRTARAVLFPLRWDEPGGTAVVEALAAGVPVVSMRRGVLPELVDHGLTGWLADDEDEFVGYLSRVDELDRHACREVAERRFSPAAMAARYETFYRRVVALAGPRHVRAPRVHGWVAATG